MSRRTWRRRRGASLAEGTLVLMLFFTLVMGMIDLGIMTTRSQSLAQAARSGAREAIVRGEFADVLGHQGPTAYSGAASDSNPIAVAVRRQLLAMNPANVRVNVTWPDGNNHFGSRVRVTAAADFTPMMTFIFGSPTWTLTGSSEMHIAH
jgi:Flp pilus assembly protein TadG